MFKSFYEYGGFLGWFSGMVIGVGGVRAVLGF